MEKKRRRDKEYQRGREAPTWKYCVKRDVDFKKKYNARKAVRRAISTGKIEVPERCFDCGKICTRVGVKKVQREIVADHYLGYEKEHRFDVQFICRGCDAIRESKRNTEK